MDVSNLLDQIPGQYVFTGILLFWFLSVIVFQLMTSISKKVLSNAAQEKFQQFWAKRKWIVAYIFILLNVLVIYGMDDAILSIVLIILSLHTIFRWIPFGSREELSQDAKSPIFQGLVVVLICSLVLFATYSNQKQRSDDALSQLFLGQIKCNELWNSGQIDYLDGAITETTTLEYLCSTISDALNQF